MNMYISIDVEASGPTPGNYSMLSIGACIVGNPQISFYRELKPLNYNYALDAMHVACLGLQCLNAHKESPLYDLRHKDFQPQKVLQILGRTGYHPREAMTQFANWLRMICPNGKLVEVAAPIKFDGGYTAWYFDRFYLPENPLGYSGIDINSLYKGHVGNCSATIKDLGMRPPSGLPHNALEDAQQQAKECAVIFDKIGIKY